MTENNTKRCPYCDNEVRFRAVKCQFCGEWFDDRPAGQGPASGSHSGISSGHHSGSPSGSPGSPPDTPSGHTPLTGIHLVNHALGDRYEILEEIGRGGMATVYKAIQKSLERTVALKVVHQNLLHDTEFVARFHREAKLCASLNHPNIVTVYDEGEVSGVHFMAMEYLEGTDLHRLIRSRGRLTPEQTLQYLLPVAEALDYAHGKGYIHRDIKSANIFITGSGRVVLMDFGIAHAAAGTQLTRAGTVIGTPEYMSPEQAEGKKVDHRTDLYSLGVVMYECLAGRVPFSSENAVSTIYKVINEKPDENGFNFIPKDVKALTLRLLSKNPEHRPKSGVTTAQAIRLLQQAKEWQPPSHPTQQSETERPTIKVSEKNPPAKHFEPHTQHSKQKKQVSPAVWVLGFIALVVLIIFVNQNRETEQIKYGHLAEKENFTVHRADNLRTGYFEGSDKIAGNLFRRYSLEYPVNPYSEFSIAGNYLFCSDMMGNIYCIRIDNNEVVWKYNLEEMNSSVIVSGDKVFVTFENGLYALNKSDGTQAWHFNTNSWVMSPPLFHNGNIYFGDKEGKFYSINAQSGNKNWLFGNVRQITFSPSYSDGIIYFGSHDGLLYALHSENGELIWANYAGIRIINRGEFYSAAISNGLVFSPSTDSFVNAFDKSNGEIMASLHIDNWVSTSPAIKQDMIYFGDDDGFVYAFNTKTETKIWKYNIGEEIYNSPIIYQDDIFIGSQKNWEPEGYLYSFNRHNGSLNWRYKTRGGIFASAIIHNGILYFSSEDGYIYALN